MTASCGDFNEAADANDLHRLNSTLVHLNRSSLRIVLFGFARLPPIRAVTAAHLGNQLSLQPAPIVKPAIERAGPALNSCPRRSQVGHLALDRRSQCPRRRGLRLKSLGEPRKPRDD